MQRLFPIFVKLAARRVLVVGAGAVGEGKIRGLLDTGARIRVVAPQATNTVREWAQAGAIALEQRAFHVSDLENVFVVIAATSSPAANKLIFAEARRRQILCNVVDVPELCDFYYPAVVRRGDLQIAISTAGQSPSLARRLREQLERQFGPEYAAWVARLGKIRRDVLRSRLSPCQKKELLQSLAEGEPWREAVRGQFEIPRHRGARR